MRTALMLSILLALRSAGSYAADAVVYDFGKNGENKTNVNWVSKATIETIHGTSVQCNGLAVWDAKDPAKGMIAFTVPVASIKTGIDLRDEHLRSSDWLDAQTYPTITFRSKSIKPLPGQKDQYEVAGTFTCKGAAKDMTVAVGIAPTPAKTGFEKYGYVGDILHVEARFDLKLADVKVTIPPGMGGVKVAETVAITVDLFGFTNDKPQRSQDDIDKALAEIK